MSRSLVRVVALIVIATFALGTAFGPAAAAAGDFSKVPARKLTEKPFRGVTLVTIGDRVVCTGSVVAPNKVVTAAHCLVRNAARGRYQLKSGLPRGIRVYRGFSQPSGGSAYKSCGVSRVWAHAKFVKRGRRDGNFGSRAHDYAVLTTRCTFPRNAILRMWATEAGDGALTLGKQIRTAGYPVDPRYRAMNGLTMWRTEGRVSSVGREPGHLPFTGFVSAGMSGGPVWRTFNEASPCGRTQCVVGIVTECAINDDGLCKRGDSSDRLAVRITPQVKRLIKNK